MNKTTEALKLAEETLLKFNYWHSRKALAAIREALAEQEERMVGVEKYEPVKQEPVAWMWQSVDIESRSIETGLLFNRGADDENTDWTPLYAAPVSAPKQEPVAWAYEYGTDKSDAVNEIRWYPNLTALHKPKPEEGSLIRNVRPLYVAPVDAASIRSEALEEAAKVCRTAQAKGLQSIREAIEAAIRGLK